MEEVEERRRSTYVKILRVLYEIVPFSCHVIFCLIHFCVYVYGPTSVRFGRDRPSKTALAFVRLKK